ncbi:ribulose-phosphate 3-epimerase [Bathycoccus prasinos]|uniref:Ribulose-phosphate 3-epimerase n=1 Tax=Bathycoccus prasinos TaxID=41875 RepID=K8EYQ6_9CHLO|nr:ribulose-phosphate 3-epimerase [Bathycoccus prasinos]CCO14363.1 ribulose-phosphate 3-epimerase [Bathycoccus prasinos]|eukprot:XP_007515484.1 ribulose-phosphate 3-epimerase [Bathycoccus prasinos]
MKGCVFVGHHQNVGVAAALSSHSSLRAAFPSSGGGKSSKVFSSLRRRRRSKDVVQSSQCGSHEGRDYVAKQIVSTTTHASSSEEEATKRRNQVIVSPSIAKANLWDLKQSVEKVLEAGAEWLHVSVQDGSSYAPKISLGSPVVKYVKLNTREPMDRIEEFVSAGADVITFAPEAAKQPMAVLQKIKHSAKERERDILAGIVLNPSTGLYAIEELRPYCDVVVVMLVNPGLGTTPYKTLDEKIKRVRSVREYFGPATRVQIDGGVDERSAKELIKAGADTIVAGSAVFKSDDPARVIRALKGEEGGVSNKEHPRPR